jgi:hypothetical protein
MKNEPLKGPIVVSREDLYQQVWAKPMSRLATEYAISDRGLAKVCSRLYIPFPPRGYWAKLQAGCKVKQAPLPPAKADTPASVTI